MRSGDEARPAPRRRLKPEVYAAMAKRLPDRLRRREALQGGGTNGSKVERRSGQPIGRLRYQDGAGSRDGLESSSEVRSNPHDLQPTRPGKVGIADNHGARGEPDPEAKRRSRVCVSGHLLARLDEIQGRTDRAFGGVLERSRIPEIGTTSIAGDTVDMTAVLFDDCGRDPVDPALKTGKVLCVESV